MAKSRKTHIKTGHNTPQHSETCLINHGKDCSCSFLPDGNGRSCVLHPFGCGNILVLNQEDLGVGLHLRLCSLVRNELACYTINDDGSDGCRICFAAREYAVGENDYRLDGAIVKLTDVFMMDHENRSMRYLFHRNCGYAYAVVVSYAN